MNIKNVFILSSSAGESENQDKHELEIMEFMEFIDFNGLPRWC